MKKRNLAIFLLISILFLFFIAACDKKTENKNSKVKKDAKTEKNITAESVIVAPETKNPITNAAVEAQTANIDVVNNPTTEESIPDPPVTAPDTSVPFIVGAPVVNKQVFDMADSKVVEAFNAYYSALIDNVSTIGPVYSYNPFSSIEVHNLQQLKKSIAPREIKRFSVIDLDNDNIPEVALSIGDYEDHFFILKYYNNHIYVYYFSGRSFSSLKTDGTFYWMGSAFEGAIATLLFQGNMTEYEDKVYFNTSADSNANEYYINGVKVSKEEQQKASEYQNNKSEAVWYDFSEENIKSTFIF